MGLLSAGVVHVGCRSVVFVVLYCEHQNWMMIAPWRCELWWLVVQIHFLLICIIWNDE